METGEFVDTDGYYKEQYITKLSKLGYLSPGCRQALLQTITIRRVKAHKFLAKRGQQALPGWIQLSGISKGYFITRNQYQKIFAFWHTGEPVGRASLFLSQRECPCYIQCLSDSVFAELTYHQHKTIEKEFPEIAPINHLLIAEAAEKADIKNRIFSKDGYDRYLKFCELHPYHFKLKSRDIASYLRISESRLSNLKREHRKDRF
ncbi:Crp/Fnr family transcriptional regulator [Arcticibacter tournemirensis]